MIKKIAFKTFKKAFFLTEEKKYKNFIDNLATPQKAQERTLQKVISRLSGTRYAHRIGDVLDYRDFANKVPIVSYEDIEDLIELMLEGEEDVLFPGRVMKFEKTSGSSAREKYIPYPEALISDFTAMFRLWAYDLLCYGPELKTGTFYFSVSPQFGEPKKSSSGAKLNLEEDDEYLNTITRLMMRPFVAVDSQIKKIQDPNEFKKTLLSKLIKCKDLEVISVWNPSFLTTLFENISSEDEIRSYFPNLKLISCWGSSLARYDFNYIKNLFPGVLVQSKGLLATEGAVTIPLLTAPAPVPLLHLAFFEFEDSNGKIHRLHELKEGEKYQLIISQSGGLYRYRLGDKVQVIDFFKATPCLEFIGRTDDTSDLVGEKLTESFIESFFKQKGFKELSIVVPSKNKKRYVIISPTEGIHDEFEDYLMQSYHYRNARKLGQLKPVAYICSYNIEKILLDFYENKRQMNRGDIKFRRLYSKEWNDELLDEILTQSGSTLKGPID